MNKEQEHKKGVSTEVKQKGSRVGAKKRVMPTEMANGDSPEDTIDMVLLGGVWDSQP